MKRFLILGGCLIMVSCSSSPFIHGGAGRDLVTPSPSAAVNYSLSTANGPDAMAKLAIKYHPSLVAARHRAKRLAALSPQLRALPDPMVEISAGNMAETAAGRVDAMGGIKQKVPFPGKRRAAASAADSEAAAALADVAALELRLTERVHAAWWDLYLAHRTIELTQESRTVLESVREAVDARVAADQASQSDQIRLSNELALIDRDLAEARRLRDSATARLNSLLNRPAKASVPVPKSSVIPSLGNLDTLLAKAQRKHPEVTAAQRRYDAFTHKLKRAELEKYPDFTVGVAGASVASSGLSPAANGRDQVFATLGVEIPLWQEPRKAMIREAREGMKETEAMIESKRSDLRYRVEDAWYRAKTSREITGLFSSRLVPNAKQAYDITLTGYSAGNNSFNDLLETWRQHLAYRLQLARNQAQLGKATATLKSAIGIH